MTTGTGMKASSKLQSAEAAHLSEREIDLSRTLWTAAPTTAAARASRRQSLMNQSHAWIAKDEQ